MNSLEKTKSVLAGRTGTLDIKRQSGTNVEMSRSKVYNNDGDDETDRDDGVCS